MYLLQDGWGFVRAKAGAAHARQMVGWFDDVFKHRFQCRLEIFEVVSQVFYGLSHLLLCLMFGVVDSRNSNDEEIA